MGSLLNQKPERCLLDSLKLFLEQGDDMTGKTHLAGGVAACAAVAHVTHYEPIALLAAGAIGSLLPDICHRGSKIGRKLPILSTIIGSLFGHRTFTHSILFMLLLNLLLDWLIPYGEISMGVLIGMLSHVLLDMATNRGVALLYPWKQSVKWPVTVRTGGKAEGSIFVLLIIVANYFFYIPMVAKRWVKTELCHLLMLWDCSRAARAKKVLFLKWAQLVGKFQ